MSAMYDPLRHLPNDPSDRRMRRTWGDAAWRRFDDGRWEPTGIARGSRVVVREQAPSTWIVLLDGTLCRERDGTALKWPDKLAAGYAALQMVRNDWHGPNQRFCPLQPWSVRQGFLMRPLTGAYLAASGHALDFSNTPSVGTTPVAVVREWQSPHEGWGVFVGSGQRHALQTIGMVMYFSSADEARAAADTEVGRWKKSGEWPTAARRPSP